MVTDRKIIVSNGRNTIDITEHPYYVESKNGFDGMNVQVVTSQGYGQDGASLINSYVLPRDMEINGQITAQTNVNMQQLKESIINLFLPKTPLTVNYYCAGQNRVITAMVETTPKFTDDKISRIKNYSVSLKAIDPFWRDATESLVQMANYRGGLRFPLRIPKNKGVHFAVKSSALIANVYNKSNLKTGMRFVFIANGTVKNPQLFNVKTRESFKLLCNMAAGEEITVVTGEDKTVTRRINGAEENYIGRIDIAGGGKTFLELEPGDNLFRYMADAGEDKLEIRIYFYNKYLGV